LDGFRGLDGVESLVILSRRSIEVFGE